MSYSENVADFMHVLGPFYEAVYDGQEPDNLRRNPSPQLSEGMDKDHQEDESGYSSSINGTGTEETGKMKRGKGEKRRVEENKLKVGLAEVGEKKKNGSTLSQVDGGSNSCGRRRS